MSKESRQLILLLILVVGGIIYFYYSYLFIPKWADIQTIKGGLQERQSRYELLQTYGENGISLYNEINKLEAKNNELRKQIPQKINKPQLIVDLYTVAKVNQVQPQTVTFDELQSMDTYLIQPLTFTCLGTQASIIKMINNLQVGEDYRFTLESLDFSNDEGILSGEIRLNAYASQL